MNGHAHNWPLWNLTCARRGAICAVRNVNMWMIWALIVDCARAARRPDRGGWCRSTASSRELRGTSATRGVTQNGHTMMSAYKDLTDALPSKIGRPNKFGIPPAYFDADSEPLIDEYRNLFDIMEVPPANAQNSDTPFRDVVDLGIAIAQAKGLDATNAEAAGRISLGLFFAETNGKQNVGNARSNEYKGRCLQTGPSEDRSGQKKWAAIKKSIRAFDPALSARDEMEEARVGNLDHRLNHWTAVRDALVSAHADLFPQIPEIVKTLPDPIDQMKLFELIQIILRLRPGLLLSQAT